MRQYSPKEVVAFLQYCGFVEIRQNGSHKVMYNKEKQKRTVVPIHKKDIKIGTLLAILRQSGIPKEQLEKRK